MRNVLGVLTDGGGTLGDSQEEFCRHYLEIEQVFDKICNSLMSEVYEVDLNSQGRILRRVFVE
jgi:thermostable 8-oxoguanine DNA glycosylase